MRNNGKKKQKKLACGCPVTVDGVWLVTAPTVLHPAFANFGPKARLGLQLVQCKQCKLMLDIRLVASPLQPKMIVPASLGLRKV